MKRVIRKIRDLRGFDARGKVLLKTCLSVAKGCLESSKWPEAVVCSADIHLRNERGYTGVIHQPLSNDNNNISIVGTAGLWRWVEDFNEPIGLDADLTQAYVTLDGDGSERIDTHDGLEVSASLSRVFEHGVTHVFLAPLTTHNGSLEGMLSIFFKAPSAMGTCFIWNALASELSLLLELVTPYLISSPAGPQLVEPDEHLPVIGVSMERRIQVAKHFAATDEILLIGGPTGAGKSRLARWSHAHSMRAGKPFEVLDLMAVPPDMQMAELVGWQRGAFTGAVQDTPGALARAQGGTLFVDEIDKLSRETQAGLLRIFEDRVFRPLGSIGAPIEADVRFIIGTNVDLKEQVAKRAFREDLYWRINVLTVELPALVERMDELREWVHFMIRTEAKNGEVTITEGALRRLEMQRWPGNLRQLHNVIRRTLALATLGHNGIQTVVEEFHVEQALAREDSIYEERLGYTLLRAAKVLAEQLKAANKKSPGTLPLEAADALRALVLIELAQESEIGDIYEMLGKENLVKNRNHQRAFSRELESLRAIAPYSAEIQSILDSL